MARRRLHLFAALIAFAAAGAQARAADYGGPSLGASQPLPAAEPQLEFGTGWYIRGDIGAAAQTQPKLSTDLNWLTDSKRRRSWSFDGGVGYQINNWLRADVTLDYRSVDRRAGVFGQYTCPNNYFTDPVTGLTSLVTTTCSVRQSANINSLAGLFNGYADLGTWGGLTPYLGAGVGFARITNNASVAYTDALGNSYGPVLVNPVTGVATNYNFNQSSSRSSYNFAYALMGGVTYSLTQNAKLDLGYRYLNLGGAAGFASSTGSVVKKDITAHEVRAGIRYMVD